jgi:glutamine amidotransferase
MGWNALELNGGRLFNGLPENPYVYFVHSYYLKADDRDDVKAKTFYSVSIDASVEKGNVFACQFHPEKSAELGLQILRNFTNV